MSLPPKPTRCPSRAPPCSRCPCCGRRTTPRCGSSTRRTPRRRPRSSPPCACSSRSCPSRWCFCRWRGTRRVARTTDSLRAPTELQNATSFCSRAPAPSWASSTPPGRRSRRSASSAPQRRAPDSCCPPSMCSCPSARPRPGRRSRQKCSWGSPSRPSGCTSPRPPVWKTRSRRMPPLATPSSPPPPPRAISISAPATRVVWPPPRSIARSLCGWARTRRGWTPQSSPPRRLWR
mmetsp:Transcript_7712/g.32152  ORF Transcript_7712/g.32152 Transcript_7712/m.32152 type:complete len:234 (+) Transcript_7712:194-895(+)